MEIFAGLSFILQFVLLLFFDILLREHFMLVFAIGAVAT
jgi:hypothetical protein